MSGPIVVGFDGSPESVAATGWAAREALLRGLSLELVEAWPWPKADVPGTGDAIAWSRQRLAEKEAELRSVLAAGAEVTSTHVPEDPAEALEAAGRHAAMLVLGSRGLGALRGFLVGSVSQEVLRRAACPVVLVRAEEGPTAPEGPVFGGPAADAAAEGAVLLGLDLRHDSAEVIAFAFEAARLRSVPLRVVHAWMPPTGSEYMAFAAIGGMDAELSAAEQRQFEAALSPWRERHPRAAVEAELVRGHAAAAVVDAAADGTGLVVVGRRVRHAPVGAHLGPVAHAVIHHVRCPVAIVSYG
ncbi:universal stress protein [Kitasatospora sp. A2-31]|uniref:universal stress protein n=1 Tax=Kitasatospora sp. A2-31 TaxID=2916414 RepID=UPI001EEA6891|nr:universal stress protein [Kitasatospora sp. A2-31]MCG6494290.1 universal stress protein [Kitasatospora sp. A2-31]